MKTYVAAFPFLLPGLSAIAPAFHPKSQAGVSWQTKGAWPVLLTLWVIALVCAALAKEKSPTHEDGRKELAHSGLLLECLQQHWPR